MSAAAGAIEPNPTAKHQRPARRALARSNWNGNRLELMGGGAGATHKAEKIFPRTGSLITVLC